MVLYILRDASARSKHFRMPCRQTTARSLVREALLLGVRRAAGRGLGGAARARCSRSMSLASPRPPCSRPCAQALVRATGRRESASDPAFGGLIADAPKYVQSYDRGPQGELQVLFNAAAVDKAIAAARPQRLGPEPPIHSGGALSVA